MKSIIRVIITGSTGMVGEGVLLECLEDKRVGSILVINRRSCGVTHPKLKEIIHPDFFQLETIESDLSGFDACFFCAGVSSIGMKETDYKRITYDLTINFAHTLARLNSDMTFCYVSGSGTDSSEKGRIMWARVKGKTENDLMKLPFRAVYAFRPGFMKPTGGQKNALKFYRYINWLYPLMHALMPGYFGTLKDVARAMINCVFVTPDFKVLETRDIETLAKKEQP